MEIHETYHPVEEETLVVSVTPLVFQNKMNILIRYHFDHGDIPD